MSEEDLSLKIGTVLYITEHCLDRGRFTFKRIRDNLDAISELGATIKNLNPDDEQDLRNEVVDALENVLDELSIFMQFHGEDLKELKEEPNDYVEITETAMTLLKAMIDSLSTPGEVNEEFQAACEETSPFDYGMKLLDLLESDSENPFKEEFRDDPEKSMEFLMWEGIIDGYLSQLLFLESYANGLFGDGNGEKANELRERIEGFFKKVYGDEWDYEEGEGEEEGGEEEEHQEEEEQEQEEEENYIALFELESIRPMVEDIQDKNPKKSCDEKAIIIQNELEKLENIGDDLFYIICFPTSDGFVYHSTIPSQVLVSSNRGGCHVIIYRSREAKNASSKDLKKMENQVTGYQKLLRLLTLKLFVTQSQIDKWAKEDIDNNGFVIAIKASRHAAIRSTKTDVLKWGPGWWIHDTILLGLLLQQKYIILAGYK